MDYEEIRLEFAKIAFAKALEQMRFNGTYEVIPGIASVADAMAKEFVKNSSKLNPE